ncbi:hypothetical protein CLAIMM_12562 [Cladophialophora immunda]|nr:hypothetical protein CLAIMM_12562 [Cladophialophora immunda]
MDSPARSLSAPRAAVTSPTSTCVAGWTPLRPRVTCKRHYARLEKELLNGSTDLDPNSKSQRPCEPWGLL